MKKRLSILIAAVLIATLCCATAFAAVSGGWFADVKNGVGAVTGTEYHNATSEITVTAQAETDLLTVSVELVKPEQFPYRELDTLRLGAYTVTDSIGTAVLEADDAEGLVIPIGNLPAGEYTLHITSFIGEKKAEQPLPIYGDWVCAFTVK